MTELIGQKYYKHRFQKYGLVISNTIKDNNQTINGINFEKMKKKILIKSNNFL